MTENMFSFVCFSVTSYYQEAIAYNFLSFLCFSFCSVHFWKVFNSFNIVNTFHNWNRMRYFGRIQVHPKPLSSQMCKFHPKPLSSQMCKFHPKLLSSQYHFHPKPLSSQKRFWWENNSKQELKQYSPCLCESVAGRRPGTPSHKHGLCP